MKKSILLLAILFTVLCGFSQSHYNIVIFSEDGEAFFAYVNGIRQNDKPETNIKVTDLNSQALNVRIQFENKSLPILKQNMIPEAGYEHTVKIKRNAKKVMKMQYFGKVELANAPRTNVSTVSYHTAENPISTQEDVTTNTQPVSNNNSSSTSSVPAETINSSVNINVNPNGVNMTMPGANVNIDDAHTNTSVTTNTVGNPKPRTKNTGTTVTVNNNVNTSTSSEDVHTGVTISSNTVSTSKPKTKNTGSVVTTSTNSLNNAANYNTTTSTTVISSSSSVATNSPRPGSNVTTQPVANTCANPMGDEAYKKLYNRIDDTAFSDAKLSTAKAATKAACVTAEQIKGICSLLGMDDDKLAYAKYAYDYCSDKANYYLVGDAFSFSMTADKLNKFISEK